MMPDFLVAAFARYDAAVPKGRDVVVESKYQAAADQLRIALRRAREQGYTGPVVMGLER